MYNNYQMDRQAGIITPLLLGGVTGYALGKNNNNHMPMVYYPYPRPIYYNQYPVYQYNPYYY